MAILRNMQEVYLAIISQLLLDNGLFSQRDRYQLEREETKGERDKEERNGKKKKKRNLLFYSVRTILHFHINSYVFYLNFMKLPFYPSLN